MKALIVVPAYRESGRIAALLDGIPACAVAGASVRWLIVDDGGGEREAAALRALLDERSLSSSVELLSRPHEGKGAALAAGLRRGLEQGYDLLACLDADASASPSEAGRVLSHLAGREKLAGVIGSRVLMLGRTVRRRPLRHYAGRVFATYVSLLFDAPVYDTQCGLKAFRADALRRHLDAPTDVRWVWDTQLLLSLLAAGEALEEFPIDWSETPGSRLGPLDPLCMAWSLLKFRFSGCGARTRGSA